jgi:hypothetical protein
MDGSLVTSILDNLDPHVALKMLEKLTSTSVIDNQTASKLRVDRIHVA